MDICREDKCCMDKCHPDSWNLTLIVLLIGWSEMKKFLVETEDKAAEYGSQYSGYDYYNGQYSDYNGGR